MAADNSLLPLNVGVAAKPPVSSSKPAACITPAKARTWCHTLPKFNSVKLKNGTLAAWRFLTWKPSLDSVPCFLNLGSVNLLCPTSNSYLWWAILSIQYLWLSNEVVDDSLILNHESYRWWWFMINDGHLWILIVIHDWWLWRLLMIAFSHN